jgi:hypothetical protein
VLRPNATVGFYDKEGTQWGGDSVDYDYAAPGEYYVGVRSYKNSTFSITAVVSNMDCVWAKRQHSHEYTTMLDGVPQAGVLHRDCMDYFVFDLRSFPKGHVQELRITLSQRYGDADLFVNTGMDFPSRHNTSQWTSDSTNQDEIVIRNPEATTYVIGVYAYESAAYTVTVATDYIVTELFEGSSIQGSLQKGEYRRYQYSISPWTVKDFAVHLTAVHGDPDLFIGTSELFASAHDVNRTQGASTWRSQMYRSDSITIDRDDDNFCKHTDSSMMQHPRNRNTWCSYYIVVYASSDCQYTITAVNEETLSLSNGVPQHGTVEEESMVYFKFQELDRNEDVTFSVTAFTGHVQLFVRANKEPSIRDYDATNSYYYTDHSSVQIHPGKDYYCGGQPKCVYYVGVYGRRVFETRSHSAPASFDIQVTTKFQTIRLSNGVAHNENVEAHGWENFRFFNYRHGADLAVEVTATIGDPDIFVSRKSEKPDFSHSEIGRSVSGGSDIVYVTNATVGEYYIGVNAFTNCSFAITATVVDDKDQQNTDTHYLFDGKPQRGILKAHTYRYYSFFMDEDGELEISVNADVGDPDIYVTRVKYAWEGPLMDRRRLLQGPDGENHNVPPVGPVITPVTPTPVRVPNRPTKDDPASYQYKSEQEGSEDLTIPLVNWGEYIIALYAWSTTEFTIVASEPQSFLQLIAGIAQREDLNGKQWEYFMLPVLNTNEDLTITVTPFYGDPDIYISTDKTKPYPTLDSELRSAQYKEDALTIEKEHLVADSVVYIGVYAYTNCSFSIVATYAEDVRLQDGVPQEGHVAGEAVQYYYIDVGDEHTDLSVVLNPSVSFARMYVNTGLQRPQPGNSTSYVWKTGYNWGWSWGLGSNYEHDEDTITIRTRDPSFCKNCRYNIMVVGSASTNVGTKYSITATSSVHSTRLQNGVAHKGWVDTGKYQYYTFDVRGDEVDVSFVVTPITGDPDIYVSAVSPKPTKDNKQWFSQRSGGDAVHIEYADDNFVRGRYHIAVYAYHNSTYTILADVLDISQAVYNHTVVLRSGMAQMGFAKAGVDHFYEFSTSNGGFEDTTVTVTPVFGDPDLYVDYRWWNKEKGSAKYKSLRWGRDALTTKECRGCVYLIMVSAASETLFSIVATTKSEALQLVPGVSSYEAVNENEMEYFKIRVDRPNVDLVLSLVSFSGDADMYIARGPGLPNATSFEYMNADFGSDFRLIRNAPRAVYYIGVSGFLDTSFSLTAHLEGEGALIQLIDGEPTEDLLAAGESRYFAVTIQDPTMTEDVELRLTNQDFGSDATMYVGVASGDKQGKRPSNAKYTWTSKDAQGSGDGLRNRIVIAADDTHACFNCTYIVTVEAAAASRYSLLATVKKGTAPILSPGKPTAPGRVHKGHVTYFRFHTTDLKQAIDILLTVFSGDARVYIAEESVTRKPNKMTYATSLKPGEKSFGKIVRSEDDSGGGGDFIHRQAGSYVRGVYYVGVEALADTVFSIAVAKAAVELTDGQSVNAQISRENDFLSFFHFRGKPGTDTTITISTASEQAPYELYIADGYSRSKLPSKNDASSYKFFARITDPQKGYRISALQAITAQFYIGVYGPNGEKFAIKASTGESIDILGAGNKVVAAVTVGDFRYFETFVPADGDLKVVMEPCLGHAEMFVSQNEFRPTLDRNDGEYREVDAPDVMTMKDGNYAKQTFYVGVLGKGVAGSEVRFKLASTKTSEKESIKFTADDGKLFPEPVNVEITQAELAAIKLDPTKQRGRAKMQIVFAPVIADPAPPRGMLFPGGNSPKNKIVKYEIVWDGSDHLEQSGRVLYTPCGLQYVNATNRAEVVPGAYTGTKNVSQTVETTAKSREGYIYALIEGLNPGQEYAFNVRAVDLYERERVYKLARQTTSELVVPVTTTIENDTGGFPFKYLFGIGVPIAILIAIGITVLCRKNKAMSRVLEIEMHDVPRAVVRKAIGVKTNTVLDVQRVKSEDQVNKGQTKNYSTLLKVESDGDDESDADVYDPPEL